MENNHLSAPGKYNFSGGKVCIYCGKSAVVGGASHPVGLCPEHYRIRCQDISNRHQPNRLLAEVQNPESFYNQVYRKQVDGKE